MLLSILESQETDDEKNDGEECNNAAQDDDGNILLEPAFKGLV